jgi:cysteine-rich repeat protein
MDAGETCDDGNRDGEDGCNGVCLQESGYACTNATAGAPSKCKDIDECKLAKIKSPLAPKSLLERYPNLGRLHMTCHNMVGTYMLGCGKCDKLATPNVCFVCATMMLVVLDAIVTV